MISIEAKLDAIHEGLQEIEAECKYLDPNILQALASGVISKTRGKMPLYFKSKKSLSKYMKKSLDKTKKLITIYSTATNPATGARYGFVLAKGARIVPKKAKFLQFQIDGKWIRSHGITLPPRDWLEPAARAYMASEGADDAIEKTINKLMEKLKKKGVLA